MKSIQCSQDSNELLYWKLTASYDSKPYDANSIANATAGGAGLGASPTSPASQSPPGGQSPASRNWSLSFGVKQTEARVFQDVNGLAATASNGQPFEGGLTVPVSIPFFTLTTYSFTPNYQKPGQYVNRCNDAVFFGYNTYNLRCADYKIDSQFEQEWGCYYQKQITFEINEDGWDLRVLNAGTQKYSASTGWTFFTDSFGKDVTTPIPLSLATGLPMPAGSAPEYKAFQVYRLKNFSLIL